MTGPRLRQSERLQKAGTTLPRGVEIYDPVSESLPVEAITHVRANRYSALSTKDVGRDVDRRSG